MRDLVLNGCFGRGATSAALLQHRITQPASRALSARKRLFRNSRIRRVINFADLRFQLFDGAIRPTA